MKWLHIIGVCGKATANIAKEFQKMGWFVTGSDNQFLPPASTLLEENKINTVEGFDFRHLTKEFWESNAKYQISNNKIPNEPDLVLFISHLTSKNKEYLYAKKKGLDIRPYSRILKEYLIKDESIVVIGTAGKTTTTALLTYIFQNLDLEPSYMIGADVVDIEDSLTITDSKWSIIEGDEYHNPDKEIEGKAKFLEYKPKYLVITKIGWEHFDIFPTEKSYVEEFEKAVKLVPEDGLIIAKAGDKNIDSVLKSAKAHVIRYSAEKTLGAWYITTSDNVHTIHNEKGFDILSFETKLLGSYNLENILAAVILICSIPAQSLPNSLLEKGTATLKELSKLISNFRGVKKRLEHIYTSEDLIIIDDFGIAPDRAKNSLETIHERYPEYKIISIFEPNAGSRPGDEKTFNKAYKDSLQLSEQVIIPDLSDVTEGLASTDEMVSRLRKLKINAKHIANSELVDSLKKEIKPNEKTIIVFFSTYKLTKIEEDLVKEMS